VNDGEKVERDDRSSPLKAGNSVWDGTTVRLFAARNEVVAFQLIVEADKSGIVALSVALPGLTSESGAITYAAPASDPTDYVGRPIQLFSVHYLDVTRESHADWAWKPGSAAAPRDTTGWKPVVLVPENARAGRGGFPLRVGPSLGQAIWIDVYTPRDLRAGTYRGALSITADGKKSLVPIELEILDFTLPDENSVRAMVYYEPSQPEQYHGRNLDPAYHRFAHRQRIELVHAYDEAELRAHLGRFDGTDFTTASGYAGPGEAVGNEIVPASFYGPPPAYEERGSAWKAADAWVSLLKTLLPKALSFLYLPDEPYPAEYPHVRKLAENVHSNPGPGGSLATFVTKAIVPELQGAVDIWCVPPQAFQIAKANEERKQGRRVWFYNGGRPQGPTLLIDAPATDARVIGWAAFKHGADTYFFWHGVHWLHNRQKQGERRQNVWAEPITFDNRGQPNKPIDDQGYLNGDGVLMYPGEERVHPAEDRGIAGACSTLQLANLRRGLQDHLYLTLARRYGLNDVVDEALQAVAPRLFSDAGESVGFAEHGDVFEGVRRKLGLAIAAKLGVVASAENLAERLGHPRAAKLVIVHADDLGEWHAVNAATIQAFGAGLVNSGSMLVPCPWFPEIAAWSKAHPEADLGLHIAVTSERTAYRWGPVASRDRVPSLVDALGYLHLIQIEAARVIKAEDAEVEIRAQVDRALAFGLKPTHLDSHQGVLYQRRDLFEALVRVSRDYGIPLGLARNLLAEHPFMAEALPREAPLIDRAFDITPDVPADKWGDWYEKEMRQIGPGVTAIVMHLGIADAELRAGTAERPTWGAEWRQRDLDFFTSERFRRLLTQNDLKLVTWREIAAVAKTPKDEARP
jgi:predicted glycoside hydrolase/deacetylase ChbG (UPF0249 family)